MRQKAPGSGSTSRWPANQCEPLASFGSEKVDVQLNADPCDDQDHHLALTMSSLKSSPCAAGSTIYALSAVACSVRLKNGVAAGDVMDGGQPNRPPRSFLRCHPWDSSQPKSGSLIRALSKE